MMMRGKLVKGSGIDNGMPIAIMFTKATVGVNLELNANF